jgi:large subunit ribosomal protein L21
VRGTLDFLTWAYRAAIRTPVGAGPMRYYVYRPLTINRIDWKKPVRTSIRASGYEEVDMFAVFKTGGKQYRVAAEDVLKIDKVKGEPGEIVEFGEVLVVGGDSVALGAPTVVGAMVAAEVLEQGRGAKIVAFKKRRRKNSRRKIGHRQEFTLLRITEILTDGKKPSKEACPRTTPRTKPSPQPAPATAVASVEGAADAAGAVDATAAAAPKPRRVSAKKPEKPKSKAPAKAKKPATKGKKK